MKQHLTLLTESELRTVVKECLEEALAPLKSKTISKQPKALMTIKEVCAFFNVSPSTIHCWRKQGKLQAYYKGRRVYFKRAEVLESLVQPSN